MSLFDDGDGRGGLLGAEPGRDGVVHRVPRRRGPFRLLVVVVLVLGLAAVAAVAGRALLHHSSPVAAAPDYPGPGGDPTVLHVKAQDSATLIGQSLLADGVAKSVRAFTTAASADPRSKGIQPGYYRLRQQMSGAEALAAILAPASRVGRLVLPEGLTEQRALETMSRQLEIPLAELTAAAGNPVGLALPPYADGKVQGYLYPGAYDVEPGTGAAVALTAVTQGFDAAAATLQLAGATAQLSSQLGMQLSPADVITVASLIEKESAVPADRPKVARVVYNRLRKGMRLQFDSTVNYVLDKPAGHLSTAQTKTVSPYNTYLHTGLPPGPIDSPGLQTIKAALHPTAGDWVYFVTTDKNGGSTFTADPQEFQRLAAKAQRDGVY